MNYKIIEVKDFINNTTIANEVKKDLQSKYTYGLLKYSYKNRKYEHMEFFKNYEILEI